MIVTTETGSVYHVGTNSKNWSRVWKSEKSGKLRSEEGEFLEIRQMVLGEPLKLLCPTINLTHPRLVVTSPIIRLEEDDALSSDIRYPC